MHRNLQSEPHGRYVDFIRRPAPFRVYYGLGMRAGGGYLRRGIHPAATSTPFCGQPPAPRLLGDVRFRVRLGNGGGEHKGDHDVSSFSEQ